MRRFTSGIARVVIRRRSGSASAGADRFSVREAVEVRLSRQIVKGPPGHRHLSQGLVIQAAAVLLQLPEQPATIVSWQAADHREQVLGELGIGHYPMPISLNKGPELQGCRAEGGAAGAGQRGSRFANKPCIDCT